MRGENQFIVGVGLIDGAVGADPKEMHRHPQVFRRQIRKAVRRGFISHRDAVSQVQNRQVARFLVGGKLPHRGGLGHQHRRGKVVRLYALA